MRCQWFACLALGAVTLAAALSPADARPYRRHRHGHGHGHGSVGVAFLPHGLYVGGGVAGAIIVDQRGGEELLDHGMGFHLYTGLRLHPILALELGWVATFHNPVEVGTPFGDDVDFLALHGVTADAKVFLQTESTALEPFVQGGLGLYLLDSEYFGAQSVGSGFQLGGGFDLHLGPGVALGLRGLYRGLAMGPPEEDFDDTFVSAVSLDASLKLSF
jgi:hypothetical protein